MENSQSPEPTPDPESEIDRLKALSHLSLLPHLDENFYYEVDHLQTAIQAMDIAMHGVDLDRATLPDNTPDHEVRRRWAAQLVILRNIFRDVEWRSNKIYSEVRKLLAMD